jgi:succinoglycan biosynthesis transport protein ExoP
MNNSRQTQHQPPAGMTVGDIYYVLFRHKWKIIILAVAGIGAAAVVHFMRVPPYQSQAELLIKYVPGAGAPSLPGNDQNDVVVPGNVIDTEIKILTSLDLANEAATNFGAANILAGAGGGDSPLQAAALIQQNLRVVQSDPGSSVLSVSFSHPNPQIVQPMLQEIISDYFQRHNEIHSTVGLYDDALSREGTALNVQLEEVEQQLANLKSKANIISIDDTSKGLAERISEIQGAILDAQAELAGFQAVMRQQGNASAGKLETTNAQPVVPPDQIEAYNDICTRLDLFRKKEQDYLTQGFTKSNLLVQEADGQVADMQKAKIDLEKKYPQIAGLGTASPEPGGQPGTPAVDLRTQIAQVTALQAKIEAWNTQLDHLQMQVTNLNSLAPTIAELERQRQIQEDNVRALATSIEKSHIDEALDTGKTPNIKEIQMPSPPFRDWAKTRKRVNMLAFGGILAGLAWAFLLELFLDRSVRRPVEIETRLKLPLFLSIPDINRNGFPRLAKIAERRQLRLNNPAEAAKDAAPADDGSDPSRGKNGALQIVSLERNPSLQPFCEALRDRLIVYFEVRNLTHKPKLVTVTSASRGAGVSTIAAGLAAALSETGDGNVLLVDMNLEQGAAQQFYKGKAGCGLDAALKSETKQDALVQENLYVVNGNSNSDELPRVLPKRFADLVPKLKASDYDYIIFDMPPVSQTSLTSRLARFMDMVLLVIESEKTDREVVQQASTWLAESGATVGTVLNKTRQYVPTRLHQEFLGDK